MPRVIINNQEYQAEEGELLLDVARRNGAHIGFVCNGNGICSTCECKVLEGSAFLSPISRAERDWLPPSRLERGHRLACQAGVETNGLEGEVSVLTRAEEFRRQYVRMFRPAPDETLGDNIVRFWGNLTTVTWEHLIQSPTGLVNTVNRLGVEKFLFPWDGDIDNWIRKGSYVIERQLNRDGLNVDGGTRRRRWTGEVEIEEIDDFPIPPAVKDE